MNCNSLKTLKAACISAAFLLSPIAHANISTFDAIKQKATELLLQKKKSQAIQLITNYKKTDLGRSHRFEASDLLTKLTLQFVSKDAQEAYENSINLTLENPKDALKSAEQCLSLDPQQLNCLIQKAKMLLRNKSNKAAIVTIAEINELAPDSKYEFWFELTSIKNEAEFKNKQIIKSLPVYQIEEHLALIILELDRCFAVKNYSRAKDILMFFEKQYSDWPDLVFYKYKISFESSEEKTKQNIDANQQLTFYANKCKNVSRNLVRKYRYDIDLCLRILN
ncbi:MAG: hypothetical protein ABL930_03605 [Pseudobdellovibrio sp.]